MFSSSLRRISSGPLRLATTTIASFKATLAFKSLSSFNTTSTTTKYSNIIPSILSNQAYNYAKAPPPKNKSSSGGKLDSFSTDALNYKDIVEKMDKFVQSSQKQFSELRSGSGANPSLVENIIISMNDDSKRPLKSLASIVVKNPKCLTLNVFDKTTTGVICKSISSEDLGLNPQQINENSIDIPIPKMTKEMRENVVKNAKKIAEGAKDKIRDIRRNGMTKIKGQKEGASKDDIFHDEQVLQKLTDDMIAKIDLLVDQKEKEIMKEK